MCSALLARKKGAGDGKVLAAITMSWKSRPGVSFIRIAAGEEKVGGDRVGEKVDLRKGPAIGSGVQCPIEYGDEAEVFRSSYVTVSIRGQRAQLTGHGQNNDKLLKAVAGGGSWLKKV
ncbi:hypothetical protein WN48_10301 [Eufriesea mexicana]|uniref:Uncharacterized protein n=1 Tax=Eufriesea mexicana TaxID=516756 RepID=A0A310SIH7_9HYME|nr:hypothetical protein WN48_10301 [Eufriesea mexicana]